MSSGDELDMNFLGSGLDWQPWASVPEVASVWRCVVRIASGLEREEQSRQSSGEGWSRAAGLLLSNKTKNGGVVRLGGCARCWGRGSRAGGSDLS